MDVLIEQELIAGMVEEFDRLQRGIARGGTLSGTDGVLLHEYMARVESLLSDYNVEIRIHTGDSWVDGLLMTVVHTREGTTDPVVVETIRPSILLNNRIIRQGYVVVGDRKALEQ